MTSGYEQTLSVPVLMKVNISHSSYDNCNIYLLNKCNEITAERGTSYMCSFCTDYVLMQNWQLIAANNL